VYFQNDRFHSFEGRQEFNKTEEYQLLPTHTTFRVNPQNFLAIAKKCSIPLSMIAGHTQGIKFIDYLPEDTVYWDIETDHKQNFKFGFIDKKQYDDATELAEELKKHKANVAYNGFRFEYRIFAKMNLFPKYNFANFEIPYVPNAFNIDLLFFTGLIFRGSFVETLKLSDIARFLGYPVEEFESFNEEKCLADVAMMKHIGEKINLNNSIRVIGELLNLDRNIMQISFLDRLHKYLIFNEYLRQKTIPIAYPDHNDVETDPLVLKECEKGLHEGVYYFDTKNAYSTTASRLDLGLHNSDSIFTSLQVRLMCLLKQFPDQKRMIKFLGNTLVGAMKDRRNYYRNEQIWFDVVDGFSQRFKKIIDDVKPTPILYVNNDCVCVKEPIFDLEKGTQKTVDGITYTIKLDRFFEWVHFYHVNKWIGKTKQGIETRGFTRLNSQKPRILLTVRELINEKLMTINKPKMVLKLLNNPEKLISADKIKELMRKNPKGQMIMIYKNSDTCDKIDFLDRWHTLKIGFNDVLLDKRQVDKLIKDLVFEYGTNA